MTKGPLPDPDLPRRSPYELLWDGKVTKVVGGVMVKIPGLSGNAHQHGPCVVVEGVWSGGELAAITGSSSGHTHTIATPAALAVGNAVLVAFLRGDRARPVIIARL